jgi:hypothetical protein
MNSGQVATSDDAYSSKGARSEMKKVAWGAVALDILVAVGLAAVLGVLASVFIGSGNGPDRTIGVGTALAALAALAHPLPSVWLAKKEKYTGATAFAGVCGVLGGGLLLLTAIFLQASLTP